MNVLSTILSAHIVCGSLAIPLGLLALLVPKGSQAHRRIGQAFVCSMTGMGSSGIVLALHEWNWFFLIVGSLAIYLVATGWRAAWNRQSAIGWVDRMAFAFALLAAVLSTGLGMWGLSQGKAVSGIPSFIFVAIGMESAIFSVIDVLNLRAGGFRGKYRIANHVWRMITALAFAMTALFVANNELLPDVFRQPAGTWLPIGLLYIAMIYWLHRVLTSGRGSRFEAGPVNDD